MKKESLIFSVIAITAVVLIIIFLFIMAKSGTSIKNEISLNFSVELTPEGNLKEVKLKEIKIEDNGINISYLFDHSNIIGEMSSVELWIIDSNGTEINRIQDIFSIKREGLIERNVFLSIEKTDGYNLFIALTSELNNFLKQKINKTKIR